MNECMFGCRSWVGVGEVGKDGVAGGNPATVRSGSVRIRSEKGRRSDDYSSSAG